MTDYTNPDDPGHAHTHPLLLPSWPLENQHTHGIIPAHVSTHVHPSPLTINEALKKTFTQAIADQINRPTMISKLMEQELPPAEAVDFYDLCTAAARNHAIVLLNEEEWSAQWMEAYQKSEIMTVWQPFADAGYDNFMIDDDEIVVRMGQ